MEIKFRGLIKLKILILKMALFLIFLSLVIILFILNSFKLEKNYYLSQCSN